jgi:hypothetical protein
LYVHCLEIDLQPAATRRRVPPTGVEVESIDAELLPAYIWWRWTLEPVFGGCNGSKHPESLVVITLQLSELPCQTHRSEGVPYLVESFAGMTKSPAEPIWETKAS